MPDLPATEPSLILSREQAVLIASRLFAAFLLFWVIDDITILPRELFGIAHYMNESASVLGKNTSLPETSYVQRGYILDLLANLLRVALWLMGAGWFYRCGPSIQSFFAAEKPPQPPSPTPNP
jgi:hypothetical protein